MIACYIRVSTVGQNAEGQRKAIQDWMDSHGLKDAVFFVDKKTGDNLVRPAFEKLQTAVFAGQVKTIIVWKLDRLSRSLQDGINVLADWCQRGIRVVSVTQQLDFSGAIGKLLAAVFFAVAEMEQETRRERQAIGIRNAKANGVYLGRKPGTTKGKPDRARKLRDKGLTVDEIAAAMQISRRSVFNYLASEPAEA